MASETRVAKLVDMVVKVSPVSPGWTSDVCTSILLLSYLCGVLHWTSLVFFYHIL